MDLLIGLASIFGQMAIDLAVGWFFTLVLPLGGAAMCLWAARRALEQPAYSNGIGKTELAFKLLTGLPVFALGFAAFCWALIGSAR